MPLHCRSTGHSTFKAEITFAWQKVRDLALDQPEPRHGNVGVAGCQSRYAVLSLSSLPRINRFNITYTPLLDTVINNQALEAALPQSMIFISVSRKKMLENITTTRRLERFQTGNHGQR